MTKFRILAALTSALASALILATPLAFAASQKNIVVIGATAQSAPEIIKQALEQGRKVIALARRPEAQAIPT